jgi:hydrogenase expression/formation protein HypE
LDENQIPIRPETRHAAEMLGLDPLEVANEGKVVIFARSKDVSTVLALLKEQPGGNEPRVIGHVGAASDGMCELLTKMGGRRIIQKPYGEQLPRIC